MNMQTQQFTLRDGGMLSLKTVTATDEEFLLSIYASTRAAELDQVEWQPGQREAFIKWQFEMQRDQYAARFPDAEYKVICVDEEPSGRIWIGRGSDEIRLLDIALLPKSQNRGVGTILLRRLIDEANVTGKALRHMVFVLNNDAHRFYERLGFVEIEATGGYKHMEYRG
jgi:GNAT superfamily N-acetyltransferase